MREVSAKKHHFDVILFELVGRVHKLIVQKPDAKAA
jgi:hypothetical protein